jgi:hypothetical protein
MGRHEDADRWIKSFLDAKGYIGAKFLKKMSDTFDNFDRVHGCVDFGCEGNSAAIDVPTFHACI